MSENTSAHQQYDDYIKLHRTGEIAQSVEVLKKIIADFPDFALAYNALAAHYKKENDIVLAIENMEKYCTLEPNDSFGFSLLSAYQIAAGHRAEAEQALAKANELRFKEQLERMNTQ